MHKHDQIYRDLLNRTGGSIIKLAKVADSSPDPVERAVARGAILDGGKGSGNFGHKGRPGQRGGSGAGGGSGAASGSQSSPTGTGSAERSLNKSSLRSSMSAQSKVCFQKAKQYPEGSHEREIYEQFGKTMSEPLQGRPTPEESKKMTEKFLSNVSSQLKPYAVDRYKRDLANEPKITNDLCDISEDLGTGMFGLGFRLKKASDSSDGGCRIADKIQENMDKAKKSGHPITYEQATEQLSDMVRYTQACTPENLVRNFKKTDAALKAKGYKPVKVKNTWETFSVENPYRGVNCVYETPDGTKFELQFHTAESLVGKEVQHGWYEEQRSPRTPEPRKIELGKRMYSNMASMTAPNGIGDIKNFP